MTHRKQRAAIISVKASEKGKTLIDRAAKRTGTTMSSFLFDLGVEKATEILSRPKGGSK